MEKKEFISRLKKILLDRGFDAKTVDAEMIPVSDFLDQNGMKDIDIPVESMADEITAMLHEQNPDGAEPAPQYQDDIESALASSGAEAKKEPAEKPAPKDAEPEPKAASNPKAKLDRIPKSGKTDSPKTKEDAKKPADDKSTPEPAKEKPAEKTPATPEEKTPAAPEETPAAGEAASDKKGTPAETEGETWSADEEVENIEQFAPGKPSDENEKPGLLARFVLWLNRVTSGKKAAEDGEVPEGKNKVLFWVLFAIAIPFVVAFAVLVVALYLAFWVILAALIIFLVAGLIVFVFAGALISLIGIIYGVIMIIKGETPVGLFEIGLGITVGAAVLFVGILVYNVAVRLIPFCMKLLAKLLGFALKRGKEGLASLSKTIKSI